MMKKMKYLAVIALIAVICAGVAYAAFTITSPVVQVDLRYTITITDAHYIVGSGMSLTAQVLDVHAGGVGGATVNFYASIDGTNYDYIGTGALVTDGSGLTTLIWTGADAYYYYFKATCTL